MENKGEQVKHLILKKDSWTRVIMHL